MKYSTITFIVLGIIFFSVLDAQEVQNPQFDSKLQSMLSMDVPTIDVTTAVMCQGDYIFLDARELEEYKVSHIKGAKHIGYNDLNKTLIAELDKSAKIIVYCSVGYRSEKVTEKLKKKGFKEVHNLYGSLFEWANLNYPLYDVHGQLTDSIHTYNKNWSQWVDNPKIIKAW